MKNKPRHIYPINDLRAHQIEGSYPYQAILRLNNIKEETNETE